MTPDHNAVLVLSVLLAAIVGYNYKTGGWPKVAFMLGAYALSFWLLTLLLEWTTE